MMFADVGNKTMLSIFREILERKGNGTEEGRVARVASQVDGKRWGQSTRLTVVPVGIVAYLGDTRHGRVSEMADAKRLRASAELR